MVSLNGREAVVCKDGYEYVGTISHCEIWPCGMIELRLVQTVRSPFSTMHKVMVGNRYFRLHMSYPKEDYTRFFVSCKGGENFIVKRDDLSNSGGRR